LAEGLADEEWRQVWAAHLGLVNLADTGIGRVLTALDSSGQSKQTIVCFTTDHGDHLGQHAMYQKMEMYEQAINVPLIMKGPTIQKQVVGEVVSHLDLLPTLLTLLELPIPEDVDGLSLAETLTLGYSAPENRIVFSQYSGNPTIGDIRRAAITQRYKAVFDPADSVELFDLKEDPLEMRNLADNKSYRDIHQKLLQKCRTWALEHDDWVVL
jgi:arylsulfatase A-like enzyme